MVLNTDKLKKPILEKAMNKYLVNWSIQINPENLEQISRHPEVLEKGLTYVTRSSKQHKLKIFRIAELSEMTSFSGIPVQGSRNSVRPKGIAIIEASSIEQAKKVVNNLVEGFSYGFGDVSVKNFLQYDIKPLIEVPPAGGQ